MINTEGELSEAGIRKAKDLGARRRDDGIDVIHTSDLARAVQTARIALADSGIPTSTDQRLRECDYGELNGAPLQALLPRTAYVDRAFPGGQSYRQVARQTATYLADLLAEHDDQRILVIAHSANRWALEHLLLGRRLDELVDAPFGWKEGLGVHRSDGMASAMTTGELQRASAGQLDRGAGRDDIAAEIQAAPIDPPDFLVDEHAVPGHGAVADATFVSHQRSELLALEHVIRQTLDGAPDLTAFTGRLPSGSPYDEETTRAAVERGWRQARG